MRVPKDLPSFAHVVRFRAEERPEQRTYTFLGAQDHDVRSMTSAETDRRAREIAAALQMGSALGERVLILCPPGLDYIAAFYGCLYAGAIAVPAYPPGLANPGPALRRLEAIVKDASPRFILTTGELFAARELAVSLAPALGQPRWIAVDALPAGGESVWREPVLRREMLAFLQYTSGSTGEPKGVMVSHSNLLHNTEQMRRLLAGTPDDRHCGWLPPYHDMGLVAGILMVPQFGMTVTLMSPLSFVKHPYRWLKTLSDLRATITGGAPFGFDLAVRKVTPEQVATLDLSSVRVACVAAEPVRKPMLDRFAEKFGCAGWSPTAFLPCYGLAECTLMATGGTAAAAPVARSFLRTALNEGRLDASPADGDRLDLVANGPVIDGVELVIADPDTCRPKAQGELGEVWLRGASVAKGYWGDCEQTARAFEAALAGGTTRSFLRTGDIGGVVDGELYITGRHKDLIIVNGVNHHPEDVEGTLNGCHPSLRPFGGAVFSVDDGSRERVVVVHEVATRGLDPEAVVIAVRHAVAAHHGIEVHAIALIRARMLPRTTSAKIQRHRCRAAFVRAELPGLVAQWQDPRLPAFPAAAAAPPRALVMEEGAA